MSGHAILRVRARGMAFCVAPYANLTGYKQPRVIEFRKELPKTKVGKILRRELRDAPKA
ncbi:hypothetical protein [Xanthomonas arboricola]|uniref:hypothetical protein n=1 Tax=Xanthomonas arboricola TaxID=56448 RepID=UPI0018743818|nr:hypothetical protein [Xanthomonas arboricola]